MTTDSPSTDLVYAGATLDQRKEYAQAIAAAGSLLPDGLMENGRPSAGKVFLVAETGSMLGIHPIASITGVNIIKGKPTIAPTLMASLVRQRGHKLRVKVAGSIRTGDIAVKVTLIRKDDPDEPYEVTWTLDDAISAGLVDSYALNPTTKRWTIKAGGSWAKYPRQMLLHRATAEVCRQGASEVLMGVYTPEELGANVNSEGELIDVTATAVDRTRYEQDYDGPAVVAAMQAEPTPTPEPEVVETFEPAPWEDRLAYAGTSNELHKLWLDAGRAGVLDEALSDGQPFRDAILGKKARLDRDMDTAPDPAPKQDPAGYDYPPTDDQELPF